MSSPTMALRVVKVMHTVVWAMFAGCIIAILPVAWSGNVHGAFVLTSIVFIEVLVLLANRWRCPLTAVAAKYTDDRSDNFDIYLPAWLARNNKVIFGSLFGIGLALTVARWRGWWR